MLPWLGPNPAGGRAAAPGWPQGSSEAWPESSCHWENESSRAELDAPSGRSWFSVVADALDATTPATPKRAHDTRGHHADPQPPDESQARVPAGRGVDRHLARMRGDSESAL